MRRNRGAASSAEEVKEAWGTKRFASTLLSADLELNNHKCIITAEDLIKFSILPSA